MRKTLALAILGGLSVVALAHVASSTLLGSFGKAIHASNSLSTEYSVHIINGSASQFKVDLKKPNLARVETPEKLIVADGKQVTTYDKAAKTYYHQPETDDVVKAIFESDELHVWAGFFDANAYKAVASKDIAPRNRRGETLNGVVASLDTKGLKTITYYLHQQDNVARQAVIDLNDPNGKFTEILDTKTLVLDGKPSADLFAFNAPDDSKEISLADLNSAKWYTSLEEAEKAAASSNRKIFVDFFATWCGPCKRLEAQVFSTSEFKDLSSKLVFLRIDVDAQKSVASTYGITAMPTQMVLDASGQMIDQRVGYSNPTDFFAWLKPLV